jgi:hypothetical protein
MTGKYRSCIETFRCGITHPLASTTYARDAVLGSVSAPSKTHATGFRSVNRTTNVEGKKRSTSTDST